MAGARQRKEPGTLLESEVELPAQRNDKEDKSPTKTATAAAAAAPKSQAQRIKEAEERDSGDPLDMAIIGPQYESFMKERHAWEWSYQVIDALTLTFLVCHLVFMVTQFSHEEVYPGSESWFHVLLPRFLLACLCQPTSFVIVHIFIHTALLQAWQCDHTVVVPWGFYHHYVDPRMYSRTPHCYRLNFHQWSVLAAAVAFLVGNCCDPAYYCAWMLVMHFDLEIHEWYHTNPAQYTVKWNPFNPKWVGRRYLMEFLELIGLSDRMRHKLEHHAERIENVHKTIDWADFRVPLGIQFADYFGQFGFFCAKQVIKKWRGTYMPIKLDGLTKEDANTGRKWIVALWSYPANALFCWTMKQLLLLLPAKCTGTYAAEELPTDWYSQNVFPFQGSLKFHYSTSGGLFWISPLVFFILWRVCTSTVKTQFLDQPWEFELGMIDEKHEEAGLRGKYGDEYVDKLNAEKKKE